MPIEMIPDGSEPENPKAPIWRFVKFEKFKDLVLTQELYFRSADLFDDKEEGLPPDEYMRANVYPIGRNDLLGSCAQFRESFFVSCWHLFVEETAAMWHRYGEDGVAVCSRYDLLKGTLDLLPDRVFVGRVEYGYRHLWASKHENLLRLITTKREEYAHEQEVRAFLWIPDEYAGINRHYDENNVAHPRPLTPPPERVPKFQRRKIDVRSLLTGVVVNPWATDAFVSEVAEMIRENGHSTEVRSSDLAKYRHYLPKTLLESRIR